jgi:hypothetical protein
LSITAISNNFCLFPCLSFSYSLANKVVLRQRKLMVTACSVTIVSLFLPFLLLLWTYPELTVSQALPTSELQALDDIFVFNGGLNWIWKTPSGVYGYPWDFLSHPCLESYPWQGVQCSSTCASTPCHVVSLSLPSMALTGKQFFLYINCCRTATYADVRRRTTAQSK